MRNQSKTSNSQSAKSVKNTRGKATKGCKGRAKEFRSKNFDPLGSYTGVAENPYELPEQDADDL